MSKLKLATIITVLLAFALVLTSCNLFGSDKENENGDTCIHAFGDWNTVKNPSCTEEGLLERTCSLCDETEKSILSKLDHTYVNGVCQCGSTQDNVSSAPQFVVSSKDASSGETVEITVALKNNPGIASIVLSVMFDNDALTLTEVTYNNSIGGQTVQPQTMNSPTTLYWINGFADAEGDFVLATLKFTVKSDATVGDHSITLSYNADDVYDISETNLPFEIVNGKVTVKQ